MDVEKENREKDLIQMDDWINKMDIEGKVGKIDRNVLDRSLDYVGGSLEITVEEEKSLRKYGHVGAKEGMKAVWGQERLNDFKSFCNEWISDFESKSGNLKLAQMSTSGRKDLGMEQFFHELTKFGMDLVSEEDFILYTEARLQNGKLWQEGRKDERIKLKTPLSEGKEKVLSSLPPGFVTDLWSWLKSAIEE